MNESDDKALAFEYVLGTLTAEEKAAFETRLQQDETLAEEVAFWEHSVMPAPETVPPLQPKPATWNAIQSRINTGSAQQSPSAAVSFWERLLPWKFATSIALVLFLSVTLVYLNNVSKPLTPTADYVAVLVNQTDEPVLTALMAVEDSKLWLKWENWQPQQGNSLQLWAKSKRDGEIRPLLVFDQHELKEIALDEATLRLIKDSSHLIMTEEELGGSAIDEPSETIIAKGVCIRLSSLKKNA